MDIDLQMEGVIDRHVADAIRRRVRMVRREFATSGEWRVTVWPSETRGEWDVGVRAPSGWRLDSFTDAIDGLPAFVERTLRECVQLPGEQTPRLTRDATSR
jgi:hypothetical protein